jgi:UDP-glucose 4-epimerase
MNTILVTGGAGYIGSHTCLELAKAGYEVVILDNLCNSRRSVLTRIEAIAGRPFTFVEGDIRDAAVLKALFARHQFHAVIHFAGLKAVGESVAEPLMYYDNNVHGTLVLLEAMRDAGVRNMVFSSSATVYGEAGEPPFREDSPTGATNPYGRTKHMVEQILGDLAKAEPGWKAVLLRYFNPVGAHESGTLGEDPNGVPNNLMPYVSQVAVGKLAQLSVLGNDYPTPDGTGVRDYIHVVDLALGHVAAVRALDKLEPVNVFNLGTGRGHSVLEVVAAFEAASGRKVPYRIAPRRPGDVAANFADASRAERVLGWRAERNLSDMCRDAWRWQSWQAAHADAVA